VRTDAPVFVAGHRGLVGSAVTRELARRGYTNVLTRPRAALDLLDGRAVHRFFETERPEVVYLAAARVGGIHANTTQRWDFIYENLAVQNNVLGAAMAMDVRRVVFFGSSCIYPRLAEQPIREEYLLTGPLEPTNEPYAIAKIAGVKLVEAAAAQHGRHWVSLMPTNLYGPGDNFDLNSSHVLPALIRKMHEARLARSAGEDVSVTLWGTGRALREFLFVDDLATAACHVAEGEHAGLYNVGYGTDLSIQDLAELIARVVGYTGPVQWDASKSDGTPRKLLDSSRIRTTGWSPTTSLEEGIRRTYAWYQANAQTARR